MTLTVIATIKARLRMEVQMLQDLFRLLEPTQAELALHNKISSFCMIMLCPTHISIGQPPNFS